MGHSQSMQVCSMDMLRGEWGGGDSPRTCISASEKDSNSCFTAIQLFITHTAVCVMYVLFVTHTWSQPTWRSIHRHHPRAGAVCSPLPLSLSLSLSDIHTIRDRCNFIVESILASVQSDYTKIKWHHTLLSPSWTRLVSSSHCCTPHPCLSFSPSLHTYFPCPFVAHWDLKWSSWHSSSVGHRPWLFLSYWPWPCVIQEGYQWVSQPINSSYTEEKKVTCTTLSVKQLFDNDDDDDDRNICPHMGTLYTSEASETVEIFKYTIQFWDTWTVLYFSFWGMLYFLLHSMYMAKSMS